MGRIKIQRPSPALIVAVLALVMAAAGGAYAISVPKKSVGTKQLKNGAVNAKKLGKIVVHVNQIDVPENTGRSLTVSCASGERLISGGVRFNSDAAEAVNQADDLEIAGSRPVAASGQDLADGAAPVAWRGAGFNRNGFPATTPMKVYAICVK